MFTKVPLYQALRLARPKRFRTPDPQICSLVLAACPDRNPGTEFDVTTSCLRSRAERTLYCLRHSQWEQAIGDADVQPCPRSLRTRHPEHAHLLDIRWTPSADFRRETVERRHDARTARAGSTRGHRDGGPARPAHPAPPAAPRLPGAELPGSGPAPGPPNGTIGGVSVHT